MSQIYSMFGSRVHTGIEASVAPKFVAYLNHDGHLKDDFDREFFGRSVDGCKVTDRRKQSRNSLVNRDKTIVSGNAYQVQKTFTGWVTSSLASPRKVETGTSKNKPWWMFSYGEALSGSIQITGLLVTERGRKSEKWAVEAISNNNQEHGPTSAGKSWSRNIDIKTSSNFNPARRLSSYASCLQISNQISNDPQVLIGSEQDDEMGDNGWGEFDSFDEPLDLLAKEAGSLEMEEDSIHTSVTLFYQTGWSRPILHYTTNLLDGRWETRQFEDADRHSKRWKVITVPVAKTNHRAIEFVMSDGGGQYDHPYGNKLGNYIVDCPGIYVLEKGKVLPLPRLEPFLVVGDLDGAMIGNDESTEAFKNYWNLIARPQGAKLVFCSGRSLEQYEELASHRDETLLTQPDAFISSLGTRVYFWSKQHGWVEEKLWSKQLGYGWDLSKVREAAYKALAASGGKENVQFRPPAEQDEHKITLGVREQMLKEVLVVLKTALADAEVKAKVLPSGTGMWRFVDIIPARAGKKEAVEYCRCRFNFSKMRTLACGYSLSDAGMLTVGTRVAILGNALLSLKEWAVEQQVRGLMPPDLIISEAMVAFGVMDSIMRLGLDPSLRQFPPNIYLLGSGNKAYDDENPAEY